MTDHKRYIARITNCARCDRDHEGVEFLPLFNPDEKFTHYARCPATGEPVLARRWETGSGAASVSWVIESRDPVLGTEDVRVLELRPEDVIVIETDREMSSGQALVIRQSFEELFPGRTVLVLIGGSLRVVRPVGDNEEAADERPYEDLPSDEIIRGVEKGWALWESLYHELMRGDLRESKPEGPTVEDAIRIAEKMHGVSCIERERGSDHAIRFRHCGRSWRCAAVKEGFLVEESGDGFLRSNRDAKEIEGTMEDLWRDDG